MPGFVPAPSSTYAKPLWYESTTGYRGNGGGWTNVPDGDAWHTIGRDVDLCASSARGYHLGLDSDGTANSGYLSRSLSVAER